MTIEHLAERITDYKASIKTVIDKKQIWKTKTKPVIINTLKSITEKYAIGWCVQELNWMQNNDAVNIIFESFPPELINSSNNIMINQFVPGAALIFSQSFNGDVSVFILFPITENAPTEDGTLDLGIINPNEINEKIIIEKVDEFLKEIIKWEVPLIKNKLGFQ